jgi:Tfp pilus assembly protein PilF
MKDNAGIAYHLGLAYYKNGEKELARKELKKALSLDPKFPGAEEAKAALEKLS